MKYKLRNFHSGGFRIYPVNFTVILFLSFLISVDIFSQIHSPGNRKLFADHLYCSGDYLRAIDEYEVYLQSTTDDTAKFKIILSLSALEKYSMAEEVISNLNEDFLFYETSHHLKLKNIFIQYNFERLREEYSRLPEGNDGSMKLRNFSYLYTAIDSIRTPPFLSIPFNGEERDDIFNFYEMKLNLPKKDPWKAGLLSVLFPGLGKIYTGDYGDALFSALTTAISAYLAYTNFKADHTFRGVLFTGVAAWFYGGSIYGSAASANLYNAKINFSFTSLLDKYLKKKNYFLPDFGFCK
jgi:hypothetical protein